MERTVWIDHAKATAIYLVILAHTSLYEPLQNWIYVFHIPLFFFLSGYVFSFERHEELRSFAWLRFKQLIVPYISLNIITYLAWLLVLRHYGVGDDEAIAWWSPLLNALLCNGDKMVHDVPLWFLFCLYIIEVGYHFLYKGKAKRWALTLAFFTVGWLVYAFCPVRLPFCLGTVLTGMVFYALGNEAKRLRLEDRSHGLALLLALPLTVVVAHFNGRINMHVSYYGSYPLFFIGALAGIYVVYAVCCRLKRSGVVELVSRNTLLVCGLHLLSFALIKGIMIYALRMDVGLLSGSVLLNMAFAAVSLALTVAAAVLIRRYAPFMIGQRREHNNK